MPFRRGYLFLPQAQFSGDDGELRGKGRVFLKNDMPDARIPHSGEIFCRPARDYYEPFRFRIVLSQISKLILIDHHYSFQPQIWPIH